MPGATAQNREKISYHELFPQIEVPEEEFDPLEHIPEPLKPRMRDYLDDCLRQMMSLPDIYISEEVFEAAFSQAKAYALQTLDPDVARKIEGRSDALLLFLGDAEEPGMFEPYRGLMPQFVATKEHYLEKEQYNEGISVLPRGEQAGLDSLLNDMAGVKETHDLAIFVHRDGKIRSTHASYEGVRKYGIIEQIDRIEGHMRMTAALDFTRRNPHSLTIVNRESQGIVYVCQHGDIIAEYDAETDRERWHYEPILS